MPRSGGIGRFRIPPVHRKLGISTSNHEPVNGNGGNESTDFTSEFLQRCHMRSVYAQRAFLLRDRRLSQIWCENRQFADLFLLRITTQVSGVIHHPNFGDDFADQLSVTEKSDH
jgi:hypothetical protein